jgi:carbon starvation protein
MSRVVAISLWVVTCVIAALCLAKIAISRAEPVNSLVVLAAAASIFSLGYRFYGGFIAARVLALDDRRATPAERFRDGHDFEPTNKWILFGHHFAAIAGPGPLVGPTLAAQFGYLPGVLWILFGAVFAGAVHDFVVLFCSMRRDGKTLGQMAREEIGPVGGVVSLVTVFLIMIVLLAVIALVVVNALKNSPWGTFTICMTIPIALLMGLYLRYVRPGRVLECSAVGFALVMASIVGGQWVASSPTWSHVFTWSGLMLTGAIVVYGFCASALPVWMLLAPRDYLSTFVKLGVVVLLAFGILLTHPAFQLPALTRFTDGNGPIFAGKIFPFCLITIACGAISGFHALISSGTTPKMIARESHAWRIGYGSMLLEGCVAIMALIAAASLNPGVYFAVNSPAAAVGSTPAQITATISGWGFPLSPDLMSHLAKSVGETTLYGRTGGAPSLALGMAQIFNHWFEGARWGQSLLSFWYHFAIMFEALFILTTIDAGTRVGRFLLQDLLAHMRPQWKRTDSTFGLIVTSALVVIAWGYLLYQGVIDPLGGINSLWPLFGIANQLLATVALVVCTTVLLKMHGLKFIWITTAPLVWLSTITFSAGFEKIFSPEPRIGFLAHANVLQTSLRSGAIAAAKVRETEVIIFNERLDAVVCGIFLVLVSVILGNAIWTWYGLVSQKRRTASSESPFVPTRLGAEGI